MVINIPDVDSSRCHLKLLNIPFWNKERKVHDVRQVILATYDKPSSINIGWAVHHPKKDEFSLEMGCEIAVGRALKNPKMQLNPSKHSLTTAADYAEQHLRENFGNIFYFAENANPLEAYK